MYRRLNPRRILATSLVLSSVLVFGVFFVIPLRKDFIVHQKLTFPTPAATAYTIRSLHSGRSGAIALLISFTVTRLSSWCPFHRCALVGHCIGLAWLVSFPSTTMAGGLNVSFSSRASCLPLPHPKVSVTPAFIGAGMLSGLNASWSFFGGAMRGISKSTRDMMVRLRFPTNYPFIQAMQVAHSAVHTTISAQAGNSTTRFFNHSDRRAMSPPLY
ncbi:hypothetical protein M378DRAFT_1045277 [Amanita muscaria Koide BX008]|uniref:Uncharacterized protein n=1 Tax=Amanita muscaria (strain Koide BX008) TaxID=946122 RepID=A0A0C2TBQ1_AMAMK|nr:hypothetical protein M378DRAFT_1045277 [Amanita muscaria Koide BX008]